MYGKVMSISDEMMWRYYELLTDVRVEQIAAMKADAAGGKAHPMALKKELARGIVADFHSAEAAARAAEDWAKQFQKRETPEAVEEVSISFMELLASHPGETPKERFDEIRELRQVPIKLDKLLVRAGLAESGTDAIRKLKQRAVQVNGEVQTGHIYFWAPSKELLLRVGKKIRKVNRLD
jgi:tyrosyl-tRNA synthetase